MASGMLCAPSMPYMICSAPSGSSSLARASIQCMNAAASLVNPIRSSP